MKGPRAAIDRERRVEWTVARRQTPVARVVPAPSGGIRDRICPMCERRATTVLEVIDPALTHVRVLKPAKVDPEMRVLMAEEWTELHVVLALESIPLVRAGPLGPRRRIDRVRW